ncbi:MAG TPA: hypothetical protein PK812_10860, partial [Beijerinckiaceae bacterium]|nr:hypothetical protein [Beijerinckiaceae bacterium]
MSPSLRHTLYLASALAIVFPLMIAPSQAQNANLGGGFIEFLVTGRTGAAPRHAPPTQPAHS